MPKKPAAPAATPTESSVVATFDTALTELEAVAAAMESGQMSLEEALAAYERGIGLYRQCQGALDAAELRVRLLADPQQPDSAQPFQRDER